MLSRVSLLVALSLAPAAVAQPVGRWSFDEPSGNLALNAIVGRPSGHLLGNAAFSADGIAGNCVDFPTHGGGYVTMGNTYAIDANAEFSISAWVKTSDPVSPKVVVSRHFTGILNGFILSVDLGGGYSNPQRGQFYLNDNPGNTCNGTTVLTDGQWRHLVSVYRFIGTGSIRELWVDGVREAANASAGPNPHPTPSFMVGGIYFSSGGEAGYYQGKIDEVQVYDYAISADDIASLRATPTAVAGPKRCFCDLNNDGVRNTADLAVFLGRFGQPASIGSLGDINYDGVVNTGDLAIFLGRFGETCS
ncbi:MAG: hypothetical protein J0L61_12780 [Planctomycetes bacterium]|nr:hypothetical protein [Planctomycetota bacterium]